MAGIEAGSECERLAPLLSKLADGEAKAEDLTSLRPHLRTCLSCRASLREYRGAPATAAALIPAAAFASPGRPGFLDAPARLLEGIAGWSQKAQATIEMASAQKFAVVAASTVALAGGGAVTVNQIEERAKKPERAAHVERQRVPAETPPTVAPVTTPPPATTSPKPGRRAPSRAQLRQSRERERRRRAARRTREAEKLTPEAQQEFEPAWAAGEPAPTTATASDGAKPPPAPKPTPSGGGAEEFAP